MFKQFSELTIHSSFDYQYDYEAVGFKYTQQFTKKRILQCNGSHTQFRYRRFISTQFGFFKKEQLNITWILYHA